MVSSNMIIFVCRGAGVLLEGIFRKTVKHVIQDSTGKKVH